MSLDVAGRLVSGPTELAGRIESLSATGAAFVVPAGLPELPEGAQVTLFAPEGGPGGSDLQRSGRIRRVEEFCDSLGDSRSYGIEFDAPDDR